MVKNKRGQVWIETVVYTLYAFTLIGFVIGVAKPRIEKVQDKALIEQSLAMLKDIDSIISSVKGTPGNQRIIEAFIKKGNLIIDGEKDIILFEIDSKIEYSQAGQSIEKDGWITLTEIKGENNIVTISRNYSGIYNLQYQDGDKEKIISKATTPYKIEISNRRIQEDNKVLINIDIK